MNMQGLYIRQSSPTFKTESTISEHSPSQRVHCHRSQLPLMQRRWTHGGGGGDDNENSTIHLIMLRIEVERNRLQSYKQITQFMNCSYLCTTKRRYAKIWAPDKLPNSMKYQSHLVQLSQP